MADDDDIIIHSGFCCVQKIFLRTRYGLCTVYILIRRMIVEGVRADSVQLIYAPFLPWATKDKSQLMHTHVIEGLTHKKDC